MLFQTGLRSQNLSYLVKILTAHEHPLTGRAGSPWGGGVELGLLSLLVDFLS